MTSQNLSELDVDNVDFNNDWNHLPPNGNTIPPSTRSNRTLPDQDDSTDDEGTKHNNLVRTTTVVSPRRSTYYNPKFPTRPGDYNPYRSTAASPTRPVNYNPCRGTSTSPPSYRATSTSPSRVENYNPHRTTPTTDYAESLAQKNSTGNAGVKWSDKERLANKKSTVLTKQYVKRKDVVLNRFFYTLVTDGGDLKDLAVFVKYYHTFSRRFFIVLQGEKNPVKKQILNEALNLCARKWKKKDGTIYEISSWNFFLKLLFSEFKRRGILYDYKKDFNSTGDFHSVLMDDLKTGSKNIEAYGTLKNKANFDDDGDNKIRNAIMEKKLNPFQDY